MRGGLNSSTGHKSYDSQSTLQSGVIESRRE